LRIKSIAGTTFQKRIVTISLRLKKPGKMRTALFIELGLIVVTPLAIFGLKKFFKNSIRFTLTVTFVLLTLLAYSIFYITNYLNPSLIIVGFLAAFAASIVIINWLFRKVVDPIEKAIKTIDDFAHTELGTEIQKTSTTNELKRLNESVITLINWTKIILTDVHENIAKIEKNSDQINAVTHKLFNEIRLNSIINNQIENYDLSFYFDIERHEYETEENIGRQEFKYTGLSNNKNKIMYRSFSIN
jgi:methyl-accepting chemotaxis protein